MASKALSRAVGTPPATAPHSRSRSSRALSSSTDSGGGTTPQPLPPPPTPPTPAPTPAPVSAPLTFPRPAPARALPCAALSRHLTLNQDAMKGAQAWRGRRQRATFEGGRARASQALEKALLNCSSQACGQRQNIPGYTAEGQGARVHGSYREGHVGEGGGVSMSQDRECG